MDFKASHEKQQPHQPQHHPVSRRPRISKLQIALITAIAAIALIGLHLDIGLPGVHYYHRHWRRHHRHHRHRHHHHHHHHDHDTEVEEGHSHFRWYSISPSKSLQYHDCYDGLQCARLDLPMDHHRPDSPDRIALAIIRRPAKVPVTDPRYGGAILTNPGGPGGSGVEQVLLHGAEIQRIVDSSRDVSDDPDRHVDSDKDRYFDIIGFDPRGVNHSTPILSCFPDNFARQTWDMQVQAEGMLGSSGMSLRTGWRRANAFSQGCSRRLEAAANATNFLEHVNTTPVVADMVEIIERHGEWREQQAQTLKKRQTSSQQSLTMQRTKWQRGQERLQFWGFSYGTVIGTTFASMYPERVGRMVLDGVVDSEDYHNGPWLQNLHDTDAILAKIMEHCSNAGPSRCAFWRPGGPDAIRAAYEKLLHDIWDDPLSVPGTRDRGPEIVTWTDLKTVVKDALYQPVAFAPLLARLFQDITNGTGAAFASAKQAARTPSCLSAGCRADGPFSDACVSPGWTEFEATSAVLCTDALDIGRFTEDEFRAYWAALTAQSAAMGDYWAQTRLSCAGWAARAKWRFDGPFGQPAPPRDGHANTLGDAATGPGPAHPILWIANTLDTVTPLRNARKMNARFPGSVLLELDAAGHCSITAPSVCVAKSVKNYFQTGDLPAAGTVCQADVKPFDDVEGRIGLLKGISDDEDALLLADLIHIAQTVPVRRGGW